MEKDQSVQDKPLTNDDLIPGATNDAESQFKRMVVVGRYA
jgi:hypothetical protein